MDLLEMENEQHSCDSDIQITVASNDERPELDELAISSRSYNDCQSPNAFDNGCERRATFVFGNAGFLTDIGNQNCTDHLPDEKMVDATSEDDDWTLPSGLLLPNASDISENEDCQEFPTSESYDSSFENMGKHVLVYPDYIICGGTLYTEAQIIFSGESMRIECSDASRIDETLVAEWTHSDITCLGCQWVASVDAALVKIDVKTNGRIDSGIHQNDHENVKIVFSVTGASWTEMEQRIKNLAEGYKEIWKSYSSDDSVWDENTDSSSTSFQRGYFPEIAEPFEDFVYPKGDIDAVSISTRDFELLQPETFINDTIIDFYVKYLKNKIPLCERQRFHFFNSFFFRKLADLDKERSSASEGRMAFLRVRKWTRKVNLFEKDFIFIPVNFNLHWSLLVICHPGEIAKMKGGDLKDSLKLPCVLHMDSIKGTHSDVKSIIQSYIWEEWKERHPGWHEDDFTKFASLRFVPLELPQQENSFDCGLFLLHYIELFLEQAPLDFNPFKITKFSIFLTSNWFQPSEVSLKRTLIRQLICELLNEPCQQVTPPSCSYGHLSFPAVPEHDTKQELTIEMLPKHLGPANQYSGDANSSGSEPCDEHRGVAFEEFLVGTSAVSPPRYSENAVYNSSHLTVLTPVLCSLMDGSCTGEQVLMTCIGSERNHSLDEQLVGKSCVTLSPHDEAGGLENQVNSCEGKGADQNILHDTSSVKLKVIDQAAESRAAKTDTSGCDTDTASSICQKVIDGYVERKDNWDSGGYQRVDATIKEDLEEQISFGKAEIVESANENIKDTQIGSAISLGRNEDGSESETNNTCVKSEYYQDGFSAQVVAQINECKKTSLTQNETRGFDDEDGQSQIVSQDVAGGEATDDEVQFIDAVEQQPKKLRKLLKIYTRRRTRSLTRILDG